MASTAAMATQTEAGERRTSEEDLDAMRSRAHRRISMDGSLADAIRVSAACVHLCVCV